MCKISPTFLLAATTALLSFFINPSSCSGMTDYLVHIMTVPDISFAHLSAAQRPSSEGQWTKEHRCPPGSYLTNYEWLVSPEGTLWAIAAQCMEPTTESKTAKIINISTRRVIQTGAVIHYHAPKDEFAQGFAIQTWMDSSGEQGNIGERKFIFTKKVEPGCPPGAINCTVRQYLCKSGLRVCSLQAKVHGGDDGMEGGSVTHLRFRCCYFCQLEIKEKLLWSSSENDRTFHYINGTYGVKMLFKDVEHVKVLVANNDTETKNYDDGADITFDMEEVAYEDYLEESGDETVLATPVSTLLGHNGSSFVTWEDVVQKTFTKPGNIDMEHPNDHTNNNAASDALRARNRRFSKRSTFLPNQDMAFESTKDGAIKDMLRRWGAKRNYYRQTTPLPASVKADVKYTETFVCDPGFACEVRQKRMYCDRRVFIDPAIMIKLKVEPSPIGQEKRFANLRHQKIEREFWITVQDVVTVSPRLRHSNSTWEEKVVCPNGLFVRDHQQSRSKLDSATVHKGIVLTCASADGRNLNVVTSAIGAKRKWNTRIANLTTIATGYRFWPKVGVIGYYYELLRSPAPTPPSENISQDPTAVRDFYCGKNWAVCGFRLRMPNSSEAHRTSVEFKCCYNYCIPEERYQTIARIQNPVSDQVNHTARIYMGLNRTASDPDNNEPTEGANLDFILSYGHTGKQSEYLCPIGSVATSIRTKSEQGLGLTGLEMQCSRLTAHDTISLNYENSKLLRIEISVEDGKWDKEAGETRGPVTGFYVDWNKGKPLEGFAVAYGPIFGPEPSYVTMENEFRLCPPDHKVCGFSYATDAATDNCMAEPQMLQSWPKNNQVSGGRCCLRPNDLSAPVAIQGLHDPCPDQLDSF